jgi:hypothetical protein
MFSFFSDNKNQIDELNKQIYKLNREKEELIFIIRVSHGMADYNSNLRTKCQKEFDEAELNIIKKYDEYLTYCEKFKITPLDIYLKRYISRCKYYKDYSIYEYRQIPNASHILKKYENKVKI